MRSNIHLQKAIGKTLIFVLVLTLIPAAYALAGPGPSDLGDSPSGTPIDGGISLLVAAGIGYGAKKVRDAKKKAKSLEEK